MRLAHLPHPPWPARMEVGRRVYAIGDIHGRADLLGSLLSRIEADSRAQTAPGARATLVFLGDYVDCGLESRRCIDLLLSLAEGPFETYFLKGQREASLLQFLDAPEEEGARWLRQGGAETLFSYGVRVPQGGGDLELRRASAALRAALPAIHLSFLRELLLHVQFGDYVFVHAGLKPGVAIDRQTERDLLGIREPFLSSPERWPFVVVHGHTPVERLYRDGRRIAVDTGAHATGRLSAVCLDGEAVQALST